MLDLKAREQRHVILIAFDARDIAGHDMRHELLRLFEHIIRVDQDFANFGMEVIANGADHQAGFLINQEHAALCLRCAVDGIPELQEVV